MDLSQFKQDKHGFYILDDVKVLGTLENYSVKKLDMDDAYFYFKPQGFIASIGSKIYKAKKIVSKDTIADGDFSMVSEVYFSKLAKLFGIKTVDYKLARLNGKKGVISNDYNDMQEGDCTHIYNMDGLNHMQSRDDIKYLDQIKLFSYCTENVPKDFQTLSLFDFVTGQFDRNDGNFTMSMGPERLYDSVIALDYSSNKVAMEYHYNDEKFYEGIKDRRFITMGIESACDKAEPYLYDVKHSKYINKSVIRDFLQVLDDSLKGNRAINDIHNEVVDEYNVTDLQSLNRYETRLKDVMSVYGEKLQMAYEARDLDEDMEICK